MELLQGDYDLANNIFSYFNGREEDFYKAFNFPMYTIYNDNIIDYNYELLVLKIFNFIVIESHTDDIYVSDITDDGKIIVSSWGEKYLFDDQKSSWTYCLRINYQ